MTERLDRIEASIDDVWSAIRENQRQISDLNSTISTLANIVEIHERQHDESRQRADQDRALMLQLIQQLAQGGNGGN